MRGRRRFAVGDRLLFLRNERSLDVRNGTLATVAEMDAGRIVARLDDGRSVGFDVKDYTDVDHGYAITVHKAQGATFDRAYLLATPGLDRHAAYVALSRHRESVELHYGRDDVTDTATLIRLLSRDRAKDNVGDHAPDAVRAFAERRGLVEQVREVARKVRGIFASFRPREELEPLPLETVRERISERADAHSAVERFAAAWADIARLREAGLPSLPHQADALRHAAAGLDRIRPNASDDLGAALRRAPALVHDASHGRTAGALRAMNEEMRVRTDPHARADRFIEGWHELRRDRADLLRDGDLRGVRQVEQRMAKMARSAERDREMASVLLGGGIARDGLDELRRLAAPEKAARQAEPARGFDR